MLIELYADIACPWCYIGERRLAEALRQRPDITVERRWRPFQLQPDLPAQGLPWKEFVQTKFGGAVQAQRIFARVAEAGAPDGIDFRFDRVATAPNTLDAHRLVLFAAERGQEWPMADALYAAHFTDGRDLNDLDQLVALAESVGLDGEEARAYLASDAGTAEVEASQEQAERLGITGVPFYVIDGRYGLSGAQPVEVFVRALDELTRPAIRIA
jgi:predicted DsbA family dithiol-disulfide isomerase